MSKKFTRLMVASVMAFTLLGTAAVAAPAPAAEACYHNCRTPGGQWARPNDAYQRAINYTVMCSYSSHMAKYHRAC